MKSVEKSGFGRPQCVLCHKVVIEESMKPSILKAHLQHVHPTHANDAEDMSA